MRVAAAIDSFKGSLSSVEAGEAVRSAVLKLDPGAVVDVCPIADGGEGTVAALYAGLGGELVRVCVTGPIFRSTEACYCILPDGVTAAVEMASAAGLPLVPEDKRDPMHTTTFGVGQVIAHAISRGCRRFIVGIGGSATNDGGIGMLSALGYEFTDAHGSPVSPTAAGLKDLEKISAENVIPELSECRFRIACDVKNPLCGTEGCSAVFAPQKGASGEDIEKMDLWLEKYALLAKNVAPMADKDVPGAGAAGGLGFAFASFTNAVLQSGIDIVLEETGLEEKIRKADIVVTGEGRIDAQTVMGKAPAGVARLAKKYGKTVIAFCGGVGKNAEVCNENGIDAFFPVVRGVTTLEAAMEPETAKENLKAAAEQVFRLIYSNRERRI